MSYIAAAAGVIYSVLVLLSNLAGRWRARLVATGLFFDVVAAVSSAVAGDWLFSLLWVAIGAMGVALLVQARRLVALQAEERARWR